MTNRYPGFCHHCGKHVPRDAGQLVKIARRRWAVLCPACWDRHDHSSAEDRCCGDRAYEDRCAEAVR